MNNQRSTIVAILLATIAGYTGGQAGKTDTLTCKNLVVNDSITVGSSAQKTTILASGLAVQERENTTLISSGMFLMKIKGHIYATTPQGMMWADQKDGLFRMDTARHVVFMNTDAEGWWTSASGSHHLTPLEFEILTNRLAEITKSLPVQ